MWRVRSHGGPAAPVKSNGCNVSTIHGAVETSDRYDALALEQAVSRIEEARITLAVEVLEAGGVDEWFEAHGASADAVRDQVTTMARDGEASVSRLTVAAAMLADLTGG